MKLALILFIFALFSVQGCSYFEEQNAKDAVRLKLTDPESSQFRNLRTIKAMEPATCKDLVEGFRKSYLAMAEDCCAVISDHPRHQYCRSELDKVSLKERTAILRRCMLKDVPLASSSDLKTAEEVCELQPTIVCGEVNAKNKMGGYAGFKHFAFVSAFGSKSHGSLVRSPEIQVGELKVGSQVLFDAPVVGDLRTTRTGPYFDCGAK
jgi:hypothetical protein